MNQPSSSHGAVSCPQKSVLGRSLTSWLREQLSRPAILLRVALALTFLAYVRTVNFDFVYDDHLQVEMNPWLTSWRGLRYIFTLQSWAFADFEMPARFYRPLYLVWLWVIRMVSNGVPGWFHLAALLSHLLVTYLAFLLARRLLHDEFAAAIAAMLFALHPGKIEAVAWIAGATEIVHAAFFFGMFVAYFRWREEPRGRWLALSATCFAGAILAKETAVLGPAIILLYQWKIAEPDSRGRSLQRLAFLAMPFFAIGAAYWTIRMRVLGRVADVSGTLSIAKTAYTAPLAFCWYLKHLVWPFRLSLLYPEFIVRQPEAIRFAAALVLVLVVAGAYWVWARQSAEMKLAGVWLVATLAPVVGAILVLQPHDRYLYLPSFAFAIILARLLVSTMPRYAVTAALALALIYAATTFIEERYWETDRQIFTRAVEIAPDLPKSWGLLADTYSQVGDAQTALKILHNGYSRIPDNPQLAFSLALTYNATDDDDQAKVFFRRAIELSPDDSYIRGRSLYQLGKIARKEQNYVEAESLLRQAAQVAPDAVGVHWSLANVLKAEGKTTEADEEMLREHQVRSSRLKK